MTHPTQYFLISLLVFLAGYSLAEESGMVVEIKETDGTTEAQKPKETKIYRNYSSDGVVEFTDTPKKGGSQIKLEKLPTYKQVPLPKTVQTPRSKKRKTVVAKVYKSITIVNPTHDEAIRNNAGNVEVKVRLTPTLKEAAGHRIQYFIDNKLVQTGTASVTLTNVPRGTHNLQVKVISGNNKVLLESAPTKFHLFRYFKPRTKVTPQVAPVPVALDSEDDV